MQIQEHLELLVANLDHTFDLIVLSETWTPEINQNTENIKMIPGYQPYYSTKGNSLKSGCVFFVKEGLKFIERNDLNRKIANEGNEFQLCRIKIINDNNPNVIVGVFYRHPRKNSGDEFVENLKATLNKIKIEINI